MVSALALSLTATAGLAASADYGVGGTGNNVVEYLDRGISAVNTGSGMLVSWRYNANDTDDAEFQLYRDDKLIYTSKSGEATSFLDKDGKASSKYRVDTVEGGAVVSSEECHLISDKNYFSIPVKKPGSNYTPNDCSVGDVDGDGQYEIFMKWDPSNSKDNSQEGVTDNVYIDCYTLEGKQLWRIDLGKNIRAGQHYTQFLVADFDLDGKAEMTCKTADGTVDGKGKVIGDASKDYRNAKGYILDGPEYYTLFDGATGAALDTVNYAFPRGKVSDWGDNYGNRVDRFLGAVCYLDGVHPSAVSVRGYYTRMTAVAYDVVDKKLVERWKFDSGNDKKKGYGGGNHNCMPADVDNDGKQELFLGATCIDHDGKLLWANGRGHGDAMHLGDLIPDRPGLEAWVCHEEKEQGGVSLLDAKTGEAIFHKHTGKDTGRCAADNVYAGNKGAEFWGAESGNVYDSTGKAIGTNRPAQNFLIYWDGDLEREILDGTKISKYTSTTKIDTIFTADGCTANNSTKSVPCLTADILGDWREELVMAASDGNSIRVYCTPTETKVRLTTLMHDVQYRTQVAGEQNCYNQPAHSSYYLGSDVPLPERPNVKLNNDAAAIPPAPTEPTEPPAPKEGKYVKNLVVLDTANSDSWDISLSTPTGGVIFGDRDYTYSKLPSVIEGAEAILTACDSKNTDAVLAEFTAGADIDVYVLLDTRVEVNGTVPAWLSDWERTGLAAESSNEVVFALYKKTYKSGEKVTLGTNGMSGNVINYTVFVTAAADGSVLGDANADGALTVADAAMFYKWLHKAGPLTNGKACDLNQDGRIDVIDLVMLKQLLLKK